MDGGVVAAWAGVGVSIAVAAFSLAHSSKANRHSNEALELAKSAEDRADRLERMAKERHDVVWEVVDQPNTSLLVVKNAGTDIAYEVRLVVDPEPEIGTRRSVGDNEMLPLQELTLDVADLTVAGLKRWDATTDFIGTPGFSATVRVTWRSESGVPDVHTWPDLRLG